MKQFILVLIFLSLLPGCKRSSKKEILISDFIEIELTGKKLDFIPDGCYSQICLYDSIIYLIDECNENYFHLFLKTGGKEICSFGKEGKNPDEFNLPTLLSTSFNKDNHDITFWVHNVNQKKLQLHSLSQILNGNIFPKKTLMIDPKMLGAFQINILDDSIIIGKDHIAGKGLFFMYNQNNKEINWNDFIPRVSNLPPKDKIPLMYDCKIKVDQKHGKIVIAYNYFNRISIFNNEGDPELSLIIGEKEIPDFNQKSRYVIPQDVKNKFADIYLTNEYIYGLYLDIQQKVVAAFPTENDIKSKVMVFDWNGNLVRTYVLNTYIFSFSIDEESAHIYGLTLNDEGYSILLKYDYNRI